MRAEGCSHVQKNPSMNEPSSERTADGAGRAFRVLRPARWRENLRLHSSTLHARFTNQSTVTSQQSCSVGEILSPDWNSQHPTANCWRQAQLHPCRFQADSSETPVHKRAPLAHIQRTFGKPTSGLLRWDGEVGSTHNTVIKCIYVISLLWVCCWLSYCNVPSVQIKHLRLIGQTFQHWRGMVDLVQPNVCSDLMFRRRKVKASPWTEFNTLTQPCGVCVCERERDPPFHYLCLRHQLELTANLIT